MCFRHLHLMLIDVYSLYCKKNQLSLCQSMSCTDGWWAWKWSVLLWDGGGQWATLIHGQNRHVESYTRRIVRKCALRFQDINSYKCLSNSQESAEINKGRFHEILTCLLMPQGCHTLAVFDLAADSAVMAVYSVLCKNFLHSGRYACVAVVCTGLMYCLYT